MVPDCAPLRDASSGLLLGLSWPGALRQQIQVVLDVRIAGIEVASGHELLPGVAVIAAQQIGIALVVEDLRRRAENLDRMRIGAVGELEPTQPIIGGGKPEPGFGIAPRLAGSLFDRAAEVALGESEIAFAEMP